MEQNAGAKCFSSHDGMGLTLAVSVWVRFWRYDYQSVMT